jgi:hypothetical protein
MMQQKMSRRQVNLGILFIRRLKNNDGLEIYIKNSSNFTENLIIFYTIIHELSGTKRREHRIENRRS